ncbi:hypothetical protein D3C81_253830 [compost metagenome]
MQPGVSYGSALLASPSSELLAVGYWAALTKLATTMLAFDTVLFIFLTAMVPEPMKADAHCSCAHCVM